MGVKKFGLTLQLKNDIKKDEKKSSSNGSSKSGDEDTADKSQKSSHEEVFVKGIDPSCPFHGQIHVGDRLLVINGVEIKSLNDLMKFVGEEHLFEFETLQVADSESEEDDGVESNRVLNMPDKVT
jgi:PDZ domain-containing secreted protein